MTDFSQEHLVIAINADAMTRLTLAGEELLAAGELEQAAQYLQTAAKTAWLNQPDALAFPGLDAIAAQVADRALEPWPARPEPTGGRERVLHILSEAYAVGGHTRLVHRWIARDHTRDHTVIVTRQATPPRAVAAEVARHGATITSIGTADVPLLDRARAIRAIAADHDVVVTHMHPDDAPAVIALQPGEHRPPVVFMNHADHSPWIGRETFDVVLAPRGDGSLVAQDLRGIDAQRTLVMPLPCEAPATMSRHEARAKLGLPQDAEILLTIAHPAKFVPLTEHSLAAAILPTLQARPNAHVVAVGPRGDSPPWTDVMPHTGGRLHLAGAQFEIEPYYAAADLLIESYPLAGGTVVVEAALAGLPVVTYRPDARARGLFCQEPITDPDPRLHAATAEELHTHVATLLEDPAQAHERAERFREVTTDLHAGPGWTDHLEAAYARAHELAGGGPPPGPVPAFDPADETLPLICRYNLRAAGATAPQEVNTSAFGLQLAAGSPALRARFPAILGKDAAPLPEPFPGVLAAPALEAEAVGAHLGVLRTLHMTGLATSCSLALPRDDLERAFALVEPILAEQDRQAGWELDIDVVPYDGAPALPAGWLAVADAGDPRGWWGAGDVHEVPVPAAAHHG